VSLNADDSKLRITDFAIAEEYQPHLIAAIAEKALAGGFQEIGGWLPGTSAFGAGFSLTPREIEITMLKFLNEGKRIDPEMHQAAGCIHEIDHV
jgi:hypothetical protein